MNELGNESFKSKDVIRFIENKNGKETKKISRIICGVCLDNYNPEYTCEICNSRNNLNHIIYVCKKYINERQGRSFCGGITQIDMLMDIKIFLEEIDFRI